MSSYPRSAGHSTFTRMQWRTAEVNDLGSLDPETLPLQAIPITGEDVADVYVPLCSVLIQMARSRPSRRSTKDGSVGAKNLESPFVIGVSGGVAAGKSACAALLKALLEAVGTETGLPKVDLLCTDSFLYPNAVLEHLGLLGTKGFPDTYDVGRLLDAIVAVRSGESKVEVPVYSHAEYDIVDGARQTIEKPDILIVEGLNVLQPPPSAGTRGGLEIADLLDTSIYVDAAEADMARWFAERLLALRALGPEDPSPFLRWFCSLSVAEAEALARRTWSEVNLVNLRLHVAPTCTRAEFILRCDARHRVSEVSVRSTSLSASMRL